MEGPTPRRIGSQSETQRVTQAGINRTTILERVVVEETQVMIQRMILVEVAVEEVTQEVQTVLEIMMTMIQMKIIIGVGVVG